MALPVIFTSNLLRSAAGVAQAYSLKSMVLLGLLLLSCPLVELMMQQQMRSRTPAALGDHEEDEDILEWKWNEFVDQSTAAILRQE